MSVKTYTLMVPDVPDAEILLPWLNRIDANQYYTNFGPLFHEFETGLTERINTFSDYPTYISLLTSGTVALELALAALELPVNAKILVPAYSFFSSALAIKRCGYEVVFADIDEQTWGLTPEIAMQALQTYQYDAVMPVCAFSYPQSANAWDAFYQETKIPVVIDAAGAIGNQAIAKHALTMFSLHATKTLGAGEGGVIVTTDSELVKKLKAYSNFGLVDSKIVYPGTNAKLSEYHAAIGLANLARWDKLVSQYVTLRQTYYAYLTQYENITFQYESQDVISTQLCARITKLDHSSIQALQDNLTQRGIMTRRWYYPTLNQHPLFQACDCVGDLAVTVKIADSVLGLPFHKAITEDDVKFICDQLNLGVNVKT